MKPSRASFSFRPRRVAAAVATLPSLTAFGQTDPVVASDAPVKSLGVVTANHTDSHTPANLNISRVQNVGRIVTQGLEAAWSGFDVIAKGLDLNGSVTYADSIVKENSGFVATPGDTVGKRQPNIPRWRATAMASYRFNPQWRATHGAQYRTLNNADVNGFTYQGVSKYFTADLRVRWQVRKTVVAALGVENLNNYKYWNFHPYPQRSYLAELKFGL